MKAAPSVRRSGVFGFRSARAWKTLLFVVIVSALLCYVISKWDDFALVLTGRVATTPVSATASSADAGRDFLIEFKLDREKTEREQIDMLKSVIDDKEASKEVRDAARAEYLMIVDTMGKQLKIEGLLAARGFESVVFLSQDACTVVVRSPALDEKAVAQVGDTVRRVTKLSLEKVTVIPAP
ncbi:MAG: SpoIIIAH-like family protein [Bacillota bacterium]